MGHYTAHAVRLRLRADTPTGMIDVLRAMLASYDASATPESMGLITTLDADVFKSVRNLLWGASSSFFHWNTRSLKQDENGVWELLTYSSSKFIDSDKLAPLVGTFLPYMVIEDGDIIWRELWEGSIHENVIFFDKRKNAFAKTKGYEYALPGEYRDVLDCHDHGYNDPELRDGEECEPFNPPWNLVDLMVEYEERVKERARKLRREHAKRRR